MKAISALKIFLMRIVIIVLLLLPCISNAQVNKSAKELASENINVYLKKIFKEQPHCLVSLGEPKFARSQTTQVEWTIDCKIDTKHSSPVRDDAEAVFVFKFYLNDKMEVLAAETFKPQS